MAATAKERQDELDQLGEAWGTKYDIFWACGLYWARSLTSRTRLATGSANQLNDLLREVHGLR